MKKGGLEMRLRTGAESAVIRLLKDFGRPPKAQGLMVVFLLAESLLPIGCGDIPLLIAP